MRHVLDSDLLAGPHEVSTRLRPSRLAVPCPTTDENTFPALVEELCQYWGGAGWPMLPVSGNGTVPDLYLEHLKRGAIDHVRSDVELELPRRVEQEHGWATPLVAPLSGEPRTEHDRRAQVVRLAPGDPWQGIYLATLGDVPEVVSPKVAEFYHLRADLKLSEVYPVDQVEATGSLEDLTTRLRASDKMSPRQLSTCNLASGMRPDTSFFGGPAYLPSDRSLQRAAGPNIVVAVREGSIDDLILLWNLRAAHGDHYAMPIGVPLTELSDEVVDFLAGPGRSIKFGFAGGNVYVTSWSTPVDELRTRITSPAARVASPDELFTYGPGAGIPGSQVAYWSGGKARLMPLHNANLDVLRPIVDGLFRGSSLVLDVSVRSYPLPRDPTMRGSSFGPSYRAGRAQVDVNRLRDSETVDVSWPSGWTALQATARSRGLTAKQSAAGAAAVALLRSLGSVEQVQWLLHEPLVEFLYRLAERSGMSWWKSRWTHASGELRKLGVDDAEVEELAKQLGRDEPAVAPLGEGRDEDLNAFRRALGGNKTAASNWVEWAERKHLLVRGAAVACAECGAKSWLPMSALPPPVGCPGCGREIEQPYEADALKFRYRLGEVLRRVLENDCLGHLFALRWAVEMFGRRDGLVGAHPGVTFVDPQTGRDVGEADVLLLMADGSMVPFEVKRTAVGIDDRAVELMDTLRDALDAKWDVYAVLQPPEDCTSAAVTRRPMPDRPRYMLTNRQLFDPIAIMTLGVDPFAWNPEADQDGVAARQSRFISSLAAGNLDTPYDVVSDTLLQNDRIDRD